MAAPGRKRSLSQDEMRFDFHRLAGTGYSKRTR
jgi:hypothetical protein